MGVSSLISRWAQPGFELKSGHALEVACVRRQQSGIVNQCNCGNLEVGRGNSNPMLSQFFEAHCCICVERQHFPFREKREHQNQSVIPHNLVLDVTLPANQTDPASRLLFKCHCRRHDRTQVSDEPLLQLRGIRRFSVLKHRNVIGVENNHFSAPSSELTDCSRSSARARSASSMTSFITGSSRNIPTVRRQSFRRSWPLVRKTACSSFSTRSSSDDIRQSSVRSDNGFSEFFSRTAYTRVSG